MAASGASAQGTNPPSLLWQYTLMTVFMLLGLAASLILSQYGSGEAEARPSSAPGDAHFSCADFVRKAATPLAPYMSSKCRYQFKYPVVDESVVKGCEAVQLYVIYRHGTRYPTSKYLGRWRALESELRSKFNPRPSDAVLTPVARGLLNWTSPFSTTLGSELAAYGMQEQYCLAERLKGRFPKLLSAKYSEQAYSFRSTQLSRTLESAMSFARGLFNGTGPLNGYQPFYLESVSKDNDTLLRFFETECPLYDKQITNNKTLWDMVGSFLTSQPMLDGVKQVQQVLDPGSRQWKINASSVALMYSLCIHEVSLFGTSIWCNLFDNNTLAVLQYNQDMSTFWKKGAGVDITWQRSIPLLNAVLSSFVSATSDPQPPGALLRFAHAETLVPLTAFLGLFLDKQPLTASNYNEMKKRSFFNSEIVPYSSNIVFALYHCPEQQQQKQQKQQQKQQQQQRASSSDREAVPPDPLQQQQQQQQQQQLYRVRVLVNERPMAAPRLCGAGEELCSLQEFTEAVRDVTAGGESFQQLCALGS